MDISGSMMGKRLDTTKALLRDWASYVVVPGDRITLLGFDDEIRTFGPWDAGADSGVRVSRLMEPLRIRPGRRGSALEEVRAKALSMAVEAATSGRRSVSLVISDRDDSDSVHSVAPLDRQLHSRFAASLGSSESSNSEVEAEKQLAVVPPDGTGTAYLMVLLSGSRGTTTNGGLNSTRMIPLDEPRVLRHEYPDTLAGIRTIVWLAPWAILGIASILAVILWRAPAGRLIDLDQNRSLVLPWLRSSKAPRDILASRNAPGFALEPSRPGLADPLVIRASVENALSPKPWQSKLSAMSPFQVRISQEVWDDEVLLSPGREYPIEIRDHAGLVASGRLQFRPDRTAQNLYKLALVLSATALVLLIAAPLISTALPAPPPPQVETVAAEQMCG